MEFEADNDVRNALQEGSENHGVIYMNGENGVQPFEIRIFVKRNIYPGPFKENGDGMADLKQYCIVSSRPKWELCY